MNHRLLAALFVLACTPTAPSESIGSTVLTVVYAEGRVEVADAFAMGTLPRAQQSESTGALSWIVRDERGRIRARGRLADSRVWHLEGEGEVLSPSGSASFVVPNIDGTVEVLDANGDSFGIGEVHHVESAAADDDKDFDFDTDVIGPPVELTSNGRADASTRLLIVPEGFSEAELPRFHEVASTLATGLLQTDGYREHASDIRIFRQDIRSRQSGVSEPNENRDTAFNIEFGDGASRPRRCTTPSSAWAPTSVGNLRRLARGLHPDTVIIIANTEEWSGCANDGFFVVHAKQSDVAEVAAHELGHALFFLGDEYQAAYGATATCSGDRPNLASNLESLPWADMIAAGTPIPTATPFDGVGAFEGGGYCNTGIYRPAATCRMREANTPFCPVCRRYIDQSFDRFARQRRLVDVTNRSAEPVWVSCTGHPFCVGRGLAPGETARVRVVDGGFLLSGRYWNGRYLIAPADSFEIFDNVQDPFVPRASGTESDAAVDAL